MSIAIDGVVEVKSRFRGDLNLDIYVCFQFTTLQKGGFCFSKLKDLETFSIQAMKNYLCGHVLREEGHKPGGEGERVQCQNHIL